MPQLEVSQPQWVPCSSAYSRMKWTSSRRGSTSCEYTWPLIEMDTSMYLLLAQGRGGRAAEGACGEDARDVALVVGRSAAVAVGRAVRSGHLATLGEQIL